MKTSMDDLQFFQVVAASETLTAAARRLGVSLPVVSKRLNALEGRLDVRLVQRGTRRLVLTSEGALYARGLDSVLAQVRELEDLVTEGSGELRGALTVQATLGLGRAHVARWWPSSRRTTRTCGWGCTPRRCPAAAPAGVRRGRARRQPARLLLRMRRLARNRRVPCAAPRIWPGAARPRASRTSRTTTASCCARTRGLRALAVRRGR
ncbi:LysR family transcriptional regulator [Streptomyces sp. M19]